MRKKKNTLVRAKTEEKEKVLEEKRKEEMKRYRNFQVEVVNNGFIASIGCQRLVFKTLIEVADALKEYWNDPVKVEAEYMRNTLASGDQGIAVTSADNSASFAVGSTLTLRDR